MPHGHTHAVTHTLRASVVETPRLRTNVWTSGPEDGTPVLLVHGNITTGGFYRWVAEALPDDVRVVAPDLRCFGDTEALPIDATRGLGDLVDDVRSLLEVLGLSGGRRVHAAGWSLGGALLQQYLLTHADDLASLTLLAPVSPYGFGGTAGDAGTPCSREHAGTGGGTANADFVRRLAARDAGSEDPQSAPRTVLMTFFGPGANAAAVDEDFLVEELLKTAVGDEHYPGDMVATTDWPGVGPGDRGVLNALSPKHFDASGLADVVDGPPVTWVRGTEDKVVSDRSFFDLATLGELGAVPGWPGAETMPPQPMESQLRAVLRGYEQHGGRWQEVVLDGVGHGIPLEAPDRVAAEIRAHISGAQPR